MIPGTFLPFAFIHQRLKTFKSEIEDLFAEASFDGGFDFADIACHREQESGFTLFPCSFREISVDSDFFCGTKIFHMIAPIGKSFFFTEIFFGASFERVEELFSDEPDTLTGLTGNDLFRLIEKGVSEAQNKFN